MKNTVLFRKVQEKIQFYSGVVDSFYSDQYTVDSFYSKQYTVTRFYSK